MSGAGAWRGHLDELLELQAVLLVTASTARVGTSTRRSNRTGVITVIRTWWR